MVLMLIGGFFFKDYILYLISPVYVVISESEVESQFASEPEATLEGGMGIIFTSDWSGAAGLP